MAKTLATPTGGSLGKAPADQMSLWASAPVLKRRASNYVGRLLLEVWSDGGVNTVGDPSLFPHALGILQNGRAFVHSTEVPVAAAPIVSFRDGSDFLGRVIVEFWEDGPVVGVLGTNERLLLEHATKGLGSQLGGT